METVVNSRESWSASDAIGLFQQKRCHTAPSDLSEMVNSSESGLERSFVVSCSDSVSADVCMEPVHYEEREVATLEDKLLAYNRKTKLEAFRVKAVSQVGL